jgi:hypothetical protein
VGEPGDVPDRRHHPGRGHGAYPRNRHDASDFGPRKDLLGDGSVHQAELAVQEVDVAKGRLHRLSFIRREILLVEPGPAALAEQVARRRASLECSLQHGVDLVLGLGALLDELSVPGDQAPKEPGPLISHPHRRQEPRLKEPGQGSRIEPIGLGLRRGDRPHRHGVAHYHPAGVALQDPGDRERFSRGLQYHVIVGAQALPRTPPGPRGWMPPWDRRSTRPPEPRPPRRSPCVRPNR